MTANKIFFIILAVLVLASVGITFNKIVVNKDYQIVAETSCNPETEKCFEVTCDPAEDVTCPAEIDKRTTYYKEISKKAASIAACEATVEKLGCNGELTCLPNEESC